MLPKVVETDDFEALFKTKANSDLELKMKDGKSLKAHKKVLVKRSPDFYLKINPQNDVALIPEFDSKVINEFLRFVYCGKVKKLGKLDAELKRAAETYQNLDLIKSLNKL